MDLIKNNPYRTIGLLVGATAAEHRRQLTRLQRFIEAEQEPDDDFSFPALGKLNRTIENVADATSKLNLDKDKMSAALFWFYKGNAITDEPAFGSLKEGDLDGAIEIWLKLIKEKNVSTKNASAFQNLSNIKLYKAFTKNRVFVRILEDAICLKLKFLESDFIKDFKAFATDKTYKTTKKELQLLFLNLLQQEIDKNSGITSEKYLEIINKQTFTAKEDFIKGFVRKPIEQIENKIGRATTKRKDNNANAGDAGNELYNSTKYELAFLESILSIFDLKFISISDKLADELLQCSISLFNHFHETETEVGEIAFELNKKAKSIALGSVVNERIDKSTLIVEKYLKDRPFREKHKLIKNESDFILKELEIFKAPDRLVKRDDDIGLLKLGSSYEFKKVRKLIDTCKPKIQRIKSLLGASDDIYLNISSVIVQEAQEMLVIAVNKETDKQSSKYGFISPTLKSIISNALEITFQIGSFDTYPNLKTHYIKNLEALKSIGSQLDISTLSPKEHVQKELKQAENKLIEIQNKIFYISEIKYARYEMSKIKEWHFFRRQEEKDRQIYEQQKIINQLLKKSEEEKAIKITKQKKIINDISSKLQCIEY